MYEVYVGVDEQDVDNNLDFRVIGEEEKKEIEEEFESVYESLDETYKSFQILKVTEKNILKLEELLNTMKQIKEGVYGR
ncbi:MAG: hypothetical protein AMQ74_01868 [Candidatus Methanofastidiosum methylothiophilum]|uniref:Uncharacterized protein n=1 Tax=Candidatus Methanofastidiosum methylothiophilum TaxID=1705564 RepID=A0A150IM77_9EURY|nr:MAG: hypothetical protein AMQ74_01868 [Candidatus Methanofastidiosum methylthiophilus]